MADDVPSAIPEPTGGPDPERREIRLELEVPGTIEEVWDAIATGPGITSWYVPHTVEERQGGAATASFGPGPEMQVPGRVAVSGAAAPDRVHRRRRAPRGTRAGLRVAGRGST